MTWEIVLGIIALFGFVVAVVTPILKLNSSITKLNCTIDTLNKTMDTTKERVTEHGKEIDKLRTDCNQNKNDIKRIEQHIETLHRQ